MEPIYIILIVIASIIGLVLLIFGGARSESRKFEQEERKSPQEKGKVGEELVSSILRKCAKSDDRIINDILLFNETNGKSSQIDHIFICNNGVYVIETKNLSGTIYGEENWQEWKQVFANGEQKNFYSPVKQNKSHAYLINHILNGEFPVRGITVFVQGNIEKIKSNSVYTPNTLSIAFQYPTPEKILSAKEKDQIYQKLCNYCKCHPVTKKDHLANIEKTQAQVEQNICPRCNIKLVLRNGKHGSFYACPNYPKCNFTKNI